MNSYNEVYKKIKSNWDAVAKPLDSLGKLEEGVCRLGAIQGTVIPSLEKVAAVILCSDNGVVEEGVTQCDKSVTRICAENIAKKKSAVGVMADFCGADVFVYDVGIDWDDEIPLVKNYKIRKGTRNFIKEPAMTLEELNKAIETGIEIVRKLKEKNYDAICIGEMGIGNTTTSAVITASVLNLDASKVTGRGAGLDDKGLKRKIEVVKEAVKKYDLKDSLPVKALQCAGGYDIAAMTGVYLGAKKYRMPVILDGAISIAALLVADSIDSEVKNYLIASHKGREPLIEKACVSLGLNPVIDADMALGEGTGAVLFVNFLKAGLSVYKNCIPFSESGVEQYRRFN